MYIVHKVIRVCKERVPPGVKRARAGTQLILHLPSLSTATPDVFRPFPRDSVAGCISIDWMQMGSIGLARVLDGVWCCRPCLCLIHGVNAANNPTASFYYQPSSVVVNKVGIRICWFGSNEPRDRKGNNKNKEGEASNKFLQHCYVSFTGLRK